MPYTLRGNLSASGCADCAVSLEGVTVQVYEALSGPGVTGRAVADPRHTFKVFHRANDAADLAAAHGELLGEATIAADGSYSVTLNERYEGGAVDFDLYCGTVGGHVPPHPQQVALTTLQPAWRTFETKGNVAAFNYVVEPRIWCAIMARLGLWLICGQVTLCQTDLPVGGVTVSAFDRDWIQDDSLGSAVTDSAGHFHIWYTTAQFTKTPFSPIINIEIVPGPDLYFRITGPGGSVLLNESPSEGRAPGRQNVGPCFCVALCVPQAPPQTEVIPAFRYIGGYNYLTDIDSAPGGTGLTNGDHRAFFRGIRLSGPIGTTLNGQPLEYRFEVQSLPGGTWTAVVPHQILPTLIGTTETLVGSTVNVQEVVVNGANSPTEIAVTPAADGWIPMPALGNLTTGLFTPDLNMIVLDTTTLAAWAPVDVGAVPDGTSLPSVDLVPDQLFGIRLRVREAGQPATETDGGTCSTLAIDNTLYNNVHKGGSWSPSLDNDQLAVASIDVQELIVSGCSGITNSLTVLMTAAHPNLGDVSLSLKGAGINNGFTLPAATPGQITGIATHSFNVSTLPKCAYIITLSVQALLTTGDAVPDLIYDQVAFCKQ